MNDDPERAIRLKRLRIQSWRRGTKEMDLILGPIADHSLVDLTDAQIDAFEALLTENDNDLYAWVSGSTPTPDAHLEAIDQIRRFHGMTDSH